VSALLAHLELGAAGVGDAPSVRVGIDLVAVAEVADSVTRLGDRYLQRIFTPHELSCCRSLGGEGDTDPEGVDGWSYQGLAARFAAKEAALKVLRPEGARPEWQSLEVVRHDAGWCEFRLSGRAADLAEVGSIERLEVSMSHEPAMAAAVVIGVCSSGRSADAGREHEAVGR
jgi:holo-[acyl-carrier protein] synthase